MQNTKSKETYDFFKSNLDYFLYLKSYILQYYLGGLDQKTRLVRKWLWEKRTMKSENQSSILKMKTLFYNVSCICLKVSKLLTAIPDYASKKAEASETAKAQAEIFKK